MRTAILTLVVFWGCNGDENGTPALEAGLDGPSAFDAVADHPTAGETAIPSDGAPDGPALDSDPGDGPEADQNPANVIFPGQTWAARTPAQAGLDASKLNQFVANVGGSGCIVKDGYMVKSWGSQSNKVDWASAAKPVISTMLLFAVKEGKLASPDAPIKDQGWALQAKDQGMTFRHLANMTSGYARAEAPGAAWAYNDVAIKLYAVSLFDKVYKAKPNAAATAATRLGALQFQDGSIFSSRGGYGLSTSPRDFARIGWLWLNLGNWNGTQLLPKALVQASLKPQVPGTLPRTTASGSDYLNVGTYGGGTDQTQYGPGIYGLNFWFNAKVGTGASLTWPDAPADTYQANGHWNKEVLTVIPSLGLVVAAVGNWDSGQKDFRPGDASWGMNQNLKLLKEAVSP